jgi:hypothetical protein
MIPNDSLGIILGTIGTVLGISNYLRDATRLSVCITNDITIHNAPNTYNPNSKYTVVDVSNTGRRPTTISAVFLIFPDGSNASLANGLLKPNQKLEESDTTQYICEQSALPSSIDLNFIQACVKSTTGKFWYSQPINLKFKAVFLLYRLKRYLKGIAY